ncbi:MAG: cellulase family glycosylhydrolase [Spirochaetales bacterium]|nr:cellulase family glycosylhydrolase [Spirochaetales bacterium]
MINTSHLLRFLYKFLENQVRNVGIIPILVIFIIQLTSCVSTAPPADDGINGLAVYGRLQVKNEFTDLAVPFFKEMAGIYGQKPNVIYEICNEPNGDKLKWPDVKKFALQVIQAIREIDPDNIIVVGTPTWSRDVDIAAEDPITAFPNIMYDKVEFDAKAGGPTAVTVNIGIPEAPYKSYCQAQTIKLDEDMKTYSFTFTMQAESVRNARFEINLGTEPGELFFDNFKLVKQE